MAFCDEICCLDQDLLDFETGPLGPAVSDEVLQEVVLKVRRAVGEVVPLQPGEEYPGLHLYSDPQN